jgi:uncharacterized membrane protein SpoIIM required for sporulation
VNPARFLETRSPAWDTLEALVKKAGQGRGLGRLTDDELHQLTRLYPAVAVDVARSRMYGIDPATQRRINRIAIAAHGLLYRQRHVRVLEAVGRFLSRDYPRLFRKLWQYTALATALFLVAGLGAYVSARLRPSTAYLFVPGSIDLPDGKPGLSSEDISERFRRMPRPPMAAGIMTNNIAVAFNAFSLGITAGVGTCCVLLYNSMMLGGFAAHFANHGLSYPFWSFILPHGVLEIMAILLASGAGLRLGISLAIPGPLTRLASLRQGAREAVLLVLGTIPMFIVAGTIEGFVTPSHLPNDAKILLGVSAGLTALAYLLLVGHRPVSRRTDNDGSGGSRAC